MARIRNSPREKNTRIQPNPDKANSEFYKIAPTKQPINKVAQDRRVSHYPYVKNSQKTKQLRESILIEAIYNAYNRTYYTWYIFNNLLIRDCTIINIVGQIKKHPRKNNPPLK